MNQNDTTPCSPTVRPCTQNEDLFDANGLTAELFHNAEDRYEREKEKEAVAQAVDDTVEALSACSHCPFIQECRARVVQSIEDSTPPCGVVQAGIYWGFDSAPDFTLNGCLTNESARNARKRSGHVDAVATRTDDDGQQWPLTVPVYSRQGADDNDDTEGPIERTLHPWDTDWIPALPDPVNQLAVEMVCSTGENARDAVPVARLHRGNAVDVDGCEILTDADVCEVLRRLHGQGATVRKMSNKVKLHPKTIKNLLTSLGLPFEESTIHQETAILRERRKAAQRTLTNVMQHSRQAWDNAESGSQLDLCAAVFSSEMANA